MDGARLVAALALVVGSGCGERTLALHTLLPEEEEDGAASGAEPDATDVGHGEVGATDRPPAVGTDRYFPDESWMYQPVDTAAVADRSAEMTAWAEAHGWDARGLAVDFSMPVLRASASTPTQAFEPTADFYDADCDREPVPLPAGGAVEGEAGYECSAHGECHLLVVDRERARLYEQWRADASPSRYEGGCLVVWNMLLVYPPDGRGEQCTSADAAGLPIAPLLITPEEVSSGAIDHALRFSMYSDGIAPGSYVHPATHGGGASGSAQAPTYGSRWRLRPDFDESRLASPAARVVAKALQRYGMVLVGTGDLTLWAASEHGSTLRWAGLLEADALAPLRPSDFEIVDTGQRIALTFECARNGL